MNNWIILFNLFKLLYLPNEPQLSTTITHTRTTNTWASSVCAHSGHVSRSLGQQQSAATKERERHKNIIIIKNTIKCKKLLRLQQHQLCVLLEFAAYRRIEPLFRATRTSLGHLPLGQLVQFWLSTWAACLAIWLLPLLLTLLLLLHIAATRIGVWNFG